MNGIWKKLLIRYVDNFEGFNQTENSAVISQKIADLARMLQLEVEPEDVQELVDFVEGELTTEDLLELEEQRKVEEAEESEETDEVQKKFTTKGLAAAFAKINEGLLDIEQMDPNVERFTKVERNINDTLRCYYEIYKEKKKQTSQSSILKIFSQIPSKSSATPSPARSPSPTPGSPLPGPSTVREPSYEDPDDPEVLDLSSESEIFEGFDL